MRSHGCSPRRSPGCRNSSRPTDTAGASAGSSSARTRESQAALNRPWFETRLAPALAEVGHIHEILSCPGARILDVGFGAGYSTLALARAYPDATLVGLDIDADSVDMARANAESASLSDRVTFEVAGGEDAKTHGPYDAAFAFECIHDMPGPSTCWRRCARHWHRARR